MRARVYTCARAQARRGADANAPSSPRTTRRAPYANLGDQWSARSPYPMLRRILAISDCPQLFRDDETATEARRAPLLDEAQCSLLRAGPDASRLALGFAESKYFRPIFRLAILAPASTAWRFRSVPHKSHI